MAVARTTLARQRRQERVRRRVQGTDARPRLCVFRSGKHIYVQVISDQTGRTLAAASTLSPTVEGGSQEDRESQRGEGGRYRDRTRSARSARFAPWSSIATGFSITAASRHWPMPRAKRGLSSEPA